MICNRIPYLFICGYPKSGTTLLLSLMDTHPQLNVFPEELKFPMKVMRQPTVRQKCSCILTRTGAAAPSRGKVVAASGVRDYSNIDGARYLKDLKQRLCSARDDRGLLDAIFDNWKVYSASNGSNEVRYCVEKTPRNELYLATLKKVFMPSMFLYVARDPRDNYISNKRKKPNLTLEIFIQVWRSSVESVLGETSDDCMIVNMKTLCRIQSLLWTDLSVSWC